MKTDIIVLILAIILMFIGIAQAHAGQHEREGMDILYPPEVSFTEQETGDITVRWSNYLGPYPDVSTFIYKTENGNLVIRIDREDGNIPDTLSVIDVPDGYVVIGDSYKTLEEGDKYVFVVMPYAGF